MILRLTPMGGSDGSLKPLSLQPLRCSAVAQAIFIFQEVGLLQKPFNDNPRILSANS